MANTSSSSKRQWRFNHYVSFLFILIIFILLNVIGFKKYYKADYSLNRYTELSDQTFNIFKNLTGEVKITMVSSEGLDDVSGLILEDVRNLLGQYEYKSEGKIKFRLVEAFSDPDSVQDLAQRFKLSAKENVVILEYNNQNKILKASDLAEFDDSGVMMGKPAKVAAFKAEEVISGAIVSLVQGKKANIYFTTGHNEIDPLAPESDVTGASALAARIRSQNADVKKLNLAEVGQIPDDTNLIVVLGPHSAFTSVETALLKSYLDNGGKLFLLLNPRYTSGLERFLEPTYGVKFNQDVILKKVIYMTNAGSGKQAVSADTVGSRFSPEHPAVEWLAKVGTSFSFGTAQSISIEGAENQKHPEVTQLISTGPNDYWGETETKDWEIKPPTFDLATDRKGPLNIVVAIDTGAVEGGKVNLGGTRVLAVGASQFLANKEIGAFQADFFLNGMNWLLNQKIALGITPKVPKEFTVKVSDDQQRAVTSIVLLVFAGGLVVGALVWFRRRK